VSKSQYREASHINAKGKNQPRKNQNRAVKNLTKQQIELKMEKKRLVNTKEEKSS